jgi:hypothetical protein
MFYLLSHALVMAEEQILCQSIMYVQESDGFDDLSSIAGPEENAEEASCEFGILV